MCHYILVDVAFADPADTDAAENRGDKRGDSIGERAANQGVLEKYVLRDGQFYVSRVKVKVAEVVQEQSI